MTTNFSFTSFLNNNGGSSYTTNSARKPSQKQIKTYKDLCKRKRILEKDISHLSGEKLSKWIEMLIALPEPASDSQINKIKELISEINSAGGNINISEEKMARLTGGREGTASKLIEHLFQKRKELGDSAKPSDAQLKIIVEWFLCPDIPFEAFCSEIIHPVRSLDDLEAIIQEEEDPDKKWELLEKLTKDLNDPVSETITITINRTVDLGNGMWTRMTPDVFAEEVRSKLTRRQASKFIDDFRGVFYEWKKSRITAEQVRYIRDLELRLADITKPKALEFAVDANGEISQVPLNMDGDWNPMAYTPMDDLALAQFSHKEASQFIDQLKSEVDNRHSMPLMEKEENLLELISTSEYNEQTKFEQKFLIRQGNKRVLDETDAKLDEFNKLNDLIFAVESILGYEDQDAHDAVQEILMEEDASNSKIEELSNYLGNFFMATVTIDPRKNQTKWASQMARIFNMCEEVPVALRILEKFTKPEEESFENDIPDDIPFFISDYGAMNTEMNMPY